jgi:GNAT superfamily N-acetyltransferase
LTTVRLATLADTAAIVDIHTSHKTQWEQVDPTGQLVSARYEALTLYERWQQGGPWMSIETCAVHLNRLLAGSGVPLVAEDDNGQVLAEAELYESFEPAPYGHHLHVGVIVTHADYLRRGLGAALMKYIVEMARLMKCERITASHNEARHFFAAQNFRHTHTGRGVRISTQQGRAFYQGVDLIDRNPAQIKGWYMPFGRYQSGRQEWDNLFPQDWAAGIPDLLNILVSHVKLTVTNQNSILFMREGDQPGEVFLACWSARPLSNPLLTAIRDRAFRDGFHTIISYVMDTDLPLLGSDAQQTNYSQDLYELSL